MSNINCSICTEIYTSSDGAVVTRCGHLFHQSCLGPWLQRNPTCPQCRQHCDSQTIQKVFFNLSFNEPAAASTVDSGTVNELLDSANMKLRETESDLCKANDEIADLIQTKENFEQVVQINDSEVTKLKEEIVVCQSKLSAAERELVTSENRITELSTIIQSLRSDLLRETKAKEKSEEKVAQLESQFTSVSPEEVKTLKSKLHALERVKLFLSQRLDKVHADLCNEIQLRKNSEERLDKLENKLINATMGGEKAQTSSCQKLNTTYQLVKKEYPGKECVHKKIDSACQPQTVSNKELLLQAKNKARLTGWKFVWEKEGKVFARKEDTSKVYHIQNVNDLSIII